MDFFPRLSFGCLTTRMQGYIFYNLLFWKIVLDFSPDFSLQAVMCFLQALVLNTFAVGPRLFPYVGKICIFVAILTLFHSVFCYGFLSWAQFWLFNY